MFVYTQISISCMKFPGGNHIESTTHKTAKKRSYKFLCLNIK